MNEKNEERESAADYKVNILLLFCLPVYILLQNMLTTPISNLSAFFATVY